MNAIRTNPSKLNLRLLSAMLTALTLTSSSVYADIDTDEFERRKAAALRESEEYFETIRDPIRRRQRQQEERDAIDALWRRHIEKSPDDPDEAALMGAPKFNGEAVVGTGEFGEAGRLSFEWINPRTRESTSGPNVASVMYYIAGSPNYDTWTPFAVGTNAAEGWSIGFRPEDANPSGFPEVNVRAEPRDAQGNVIQLLDESGFNRAQGTLAAIHFVPEPATVALIAIGLMFARRRT
ncbi:MAG: PEP-CTERM sorting domain-containing protein [Phycisphaerales bacterium]|nr:PEP-CTERM sorting domain-containing protein [Phycisphaerales bacterium]